MDVIALGRSEFTLGFELVGLRTYNLTSVESIKNLMKEDIGVIIIDEDTMNSFDEYNRKDFEDSVKPLFVVLSLNETQEDLNKLIRRSIGIQL